VTELKCGENQPAVSRVDVDDSYGSSHVMGLDGECSHQNEGTEQSGGTETSTPRVEVVNNETTSMHALFSSSPSKQAVHIMNATSGIFADPIHYHSFTTVGSSSLFSQASVSILSLPKCLLVGTFQKCTACQARLGSESIQNQKYDHGNVDGTDGVSSSAKCASPEMDQSSSCMAMLQCVACRVYAHRSCAFARPPIQCTQNNVETEVAASQMPVCQVNFPLVQSALNINETQHHHSPNNDNTDISETSKQVWSFFGRRSRRKDDVVEDDHELSGEAMKTDDSQNNKQQRTDAIPNNENEAIQSSDQECTKCDPVPSALDSSNVNPTEEDMLPCDLLESTLSCNNDITDDSTTEPKASPPPNVFKTSIEIIRKTSQTATNIPKASAIGMVAGGITGLALAGPAGVIVGSTIGKNAFALGAALEGGMSVGVLVMSLVAASKFTSSTSEKEQRELKLPTSGNETNTLILVRPDVAVDPIWNDYARDARNSWEKMDKESGSWGSGFSSLFSSGTVTSLSAAERELRYQRDSDIIRADASELATREKIMLLVNRILNDKMSLPGYVYRYLIRKHKERSVSGQEEGSEHSPLLLIGGTETKSMREENRSSLSCRQDAHGVIKHVTATLLEVRPGLASSLAMTEMSAMAVETLVFSELYEDVFDEIIRQTLDQDEALQSKIDTLRHCSMRSQRDGSEKHPTSSHEAIAALKFLPSAHTPADKLFFLVIFLEHISAHFSALDNRFIDADLLLNMVCQHLVAAQIPSLHAEIEFIADFARDEQLLRGKEGYALITLQASLHYLDSLNVLHNDLCPFVETT